MNSYFIDPFGCVKNQVDAENMMSHLDNAGWKCVSAENADLIIVNSCGFIESAKQESINAVIEWRKLYPGKKILLAGCLSQRYKKELTESLTEADDFFGTENIAQITQAALKIIKSKSRTAPGNLSTGERPLLSLPGCAYVKISEGCNNCCSFCAIPLIRGKLFSRTITDILEECRILLDRGIKELCIVAQDIGSYGTDEGDNTSGKLPELLNAISSLKGHFWIRLLYIHPDHFPLPILDLMKRDPRFLPYFDIPFQHACGKILCAMNRHGNKTQYLELLKTIRTRLPNAVIRSTFLLGFPGETEEDFAELLDFQEKAALDWVGCFTYSREEDTAAYSMKGRVSKKTAANRRQMIEERQIPITEKNMDRFINQELEVLIEEQIDDNLALGRLYCQAPDIDGAAVCHPAGSSHPAGGSYQAGSSHPAGATNNEKEKICDQIGKLTPCKVIRRRGFDLEVQLH